MELTARSTHGFIEIKVDEIETTIFKDSQLELEKMIENLKEVVVDLESYLDEE